MGSFRKTAKDLQEEDANTQRTLVSGKQTSYCRKSGFEANALQTV
jgi:hypothetical protein